MKTFDIQHMAKQETMEWLKTCDVLFKEKYLYFPQNVVRGNM